MNPIKPTSINPGFLYLLMLLFMVTSGCNSEDPGTEGAVLKSGQRIPIGSGMESGPLSVGVHSGPVGRAFVFDHDEPDLFVSANRHSLVPGPGIYLFEWTGRNKYGVPVFAQPQKVKVPDELEGIGESGCIFQSEEGEVMGWWFKGEQIYRTTFDPEEMQFNISATPIIMNGLPDHPEKPSTMTVWHYSGDSIQIFLGINNGAIHYLKENWRKPEFNLYDGTGAFNGDFQYEYLYVSEKTTLDVSAPVNFKQFSTSSREVLQSYKKLTVTEYDSNGKKYLVTGSRHGNFLCYPLSSGNNREKRLYLRDESSVLLRHKAIGPVPLAYPNDNTALLSDLIVGGEGGLCYYPFAGKFHPDGAPVYEEPYPVCVEKAKLYTGSLPVINAVDIDNNGILDIIAGNSEGRVLLFKNNGSNEKPSFASGEELHAGGRPIHIQSGYSGSVQGPMEARWGYVCPTLFDWNNDGLVDILMNSAVSRYEVFLNAGRTGFPEFEIPSPIYCMGLDLHGTWRVQPGVNIMDGRVAYIILDDDNEFHIYWQIDPFNVDDGGKLQLADGSNISGSYLSAGGTGRLKIVLTDWDLDGVKDLLVGTSRHSSVPDPVNGLPQSEGLKGASVLFMKNVGTNSKPVFSFPNLMKFRGDVIYLGQHSCSPAVWDYGQPGGPDLMIGEQDGRIRFYKRQNLTWN